MLRNVIPIHSLMLCLLLSAGTGLFAQDSALIVQLNPGKSLSQMLPGEKKATSAPRLLSATLNVYLLTAASPAAARQLYGKLKSHPSVANVTYDRVIQFRLDPNDSQYERQWSLPRIQAPEVWELTQGGTTARGDEIVVAVIDAGFDPTHPDLTANIWQNAADSPGDGLDNDRNGYVDDRNGWNFAADGPDHELDYHGQSVSGIIGARGNNNLGVSGINWEVKLMLFSVKKVSHVIASFEYALAQRRLYNESGGKAGAFVVAINTSLGLDRAFCDDQPVWRDMYDVLGGQGILSVASPPNANVDVDAQGDIPTTCPSDFLLTTLRTDRQDDKHVNSGYGLISIDMGAPGQNIYTTQLNGGYGDFTGTSAASPHLTGAIALLYSLPCPDLADQALDDPAGAAFRVRSALLGGVDPVNALQAYALTGGRLNVKNSADLLLANCELVEGDAVLLRVWPNPTRDVLHVLYQLESVRSGQVVLYNALGQRVLSENLPPTGSAAGSKRLNLPRLPGGVYFLALRAGERLAVGKVLIR